MSCNYRDIMSYPFPGWRQYNFKNQNAFSKCLQKTYIDHKILTEYTPVVVHFEQQNLTP